MKMLSEFLDKSSLRQGKEKGIEVLINSGLDREPFS
jgi:hypothetical protein